MSTGSSRRTLIAVLVCCFALQTALVYLDDTGRRTPSLSDAAHRGWQLWHENNCQSCHQLYGFGGFLGPDLTNVVSTLAAEHLRSILTVGKAPMPAFHFSAEEISAVSKFLTEVDATGTGQFRFVQMPPATELLDEIVESAARQEPLRPEQEKGRRLVRQRKCIGCHLPNEQSTARAPDLCHLIVSPGEQGIAVVLEQGRVLRGMPPFELADDERTALLAFLGWMHTHRDGIHAAFEAIAAEAAGGSQIPWFEFNQ
jgi:nitric oxide reductase subunit C